MRWFALIVCATLFSSGAVAPVLSPVQASSQDRTVRISFAASRTTRAVRDTATGLEGIDYLVRVRAGQGLAATLAATATAAPAYAAIPFFNATCPGNIEVHADQGGPIYINGKEGKLKVFNANYYEATHNHVTISVSVNPDGTAAVSYTARGGGNCICRVK